MRGGLATFNHRLAREFIKSGYHCCIHSFALQYPAFLFPGTTQFSAEPPPEGITIYSDINSVNPINWIKIGNRIKKERPGIVVVRFWIPFMAPSLGTILRRVRQNQYSKIVCIADNIIPHEHRPGDKEFIGYFLRSIDAFITMSETVLNDLRQFEKRKPAKLVQHPLYDTFGKIVSKEEARKHLGLQPHDKIILFFGFIRKYKGLDILLEAMRILKKDHLKPETSNLKLLIAGEFYDDQKPYLRQIQDSAIQDMVMLRTEFIPDSEVKYFLCAADAVIQPYRNATQSGVTPLAYHFEKPMIVTNVGGLPLLVPHEKVGLVADPNPEALADAILRFYQLGENYFIPHLRKEKEKYSWANLVNAIIELAASRAE